jgi:hypothetical protein
MCCPLRLKETLRELCETALVMATWVRHAAVQDSLTRPVTDRFFLIAGPNSACGCASMCVCVCVCVSLLRLGAEGRVRVGESVAVLDKTSSTENRG